MASGPGFAASPAPRTPPKENLPLSERKWCRVGVSKREKSKIPVAQAVLQGSGKRCALPNNNHGYLEYGTDGHWLHRISGKGNTHQTSLPVGLYLQAGVKLATRHHIRRNSPPYSWCFSNVCVAAAPIGRSAITALGEARAISVEVLDTNLVTLTATIPTDQFASAHSGAPAEVFEQIIEE